MNRGGSRIPGPGCVRRRPGTDRSHGSLGGVRMSRRVPRRWLVAALAGLLPVVGCLVALVVPANAAATEGSITLQVQSARTVGAPPEIQQGDPVTNYRWLITADDVGDPHDALEHCLPA